MCIGSLFIGQDILYVAFQPFKTKGDMRTPDPTLLLSLATVFTTYLLAKNEKHPPLWDFYQAHAAGSADCLSP